MFVYSLRAGTVKMVGVICVALTVLITLIAFVPTYAISQSGAAGVGKEVTYSYEKVRSAADPVETKTVTVPAEFDKIFAAYNEIQKAQGLNLSKYRGREVTRYTFSITNYEGYEGTVYANVLVFRSRVIGGDICSAAASGFVHGFEHP